MRAGEPVAKTLADSSVAADVAFFTHADPADGGLDRGGPRCSCGIDCWRGTINCFDSALLG